MVIIDETGDKKKGRKTDYVKRQYIGNLGKIENGIVTVTAYGLFRSTSKTETRYIREIIFGKKREIRYWQVTKNKETLPENSTWYIMTKVPKIKYKEVGNLYGLRTLCYFNLLKPWLVVLFNPQIIRLFCRLFFQLNQLINSILEKIFPYNSCFSSA